MRFRWLLISALALILSGCGERVPHPQDLEVYANGLPQMDSVLDRFGLRHISSGSDGESVFLEVRKRNPAETVSDGEIEEIKKAIYGEYDREFPLEIRAWSLPAEPVVDGRLTGLGENQILAVEDKKDSDSNPRAMWLSLGEDTVIVDARTGETLPADRLQIGYRVRAWSEMLVAESYPEQSGLLRLEVTDTDIGQGDLQGTIEKKGMGFEDTSQRILQIDGKIYRLMESAVIRVEDREASFEELKEGDRVQVWFAGYEVMPDEPIITQVAVNH